MEREVILEVISGSHLYGTADENSDTDVRRVVMPTVDELLGLESFETQILDGDSDVVTHSLKKFIRLLMKGNMNVHEWLWVPGRLMARRNEIGKILRDRRKEFLSDRIGSAISGYLNHQVHLAFKCQKDIGEKRRKLIEKYGYNTKAAYHAVRLCWLGQTLYNKGIIDSCYEGEQLEALLEIKYGHEPKAAVLDIIDTERAKFDRCREENTAKIRSKPNHGRINNMLIGMHRQYIKNQFIKIAR